MAVRVTRVESDSADQQWTFTVRRIPRHIRLGDPSPNVSDLPEDVRAALIQWLLLVHPAETKE